MFGWIWCVFTEYSIAICVPYQSTRE
jgi:hypothetical protein